ncbi:MAG: hypothetical protein ACOZQL_43865 [Myxococcota bacterium]
MMTFVEKLAVKLSLGAASATGAFLNARGHREPTLAERDEIARETARLILELVTAEGPTESSSIEVFDSLIERSVVAGIATAARVLNLGGVNDPPRARA